MEQFSKAVLDRMAYLEHADRREPGEGTIRLRQISKETGQFLLNLARTAPQGEFLEIGTSGGYSALWLSQACKERDITLTTFEREPYKQKIAEETFNTTNTTIHFIKDDAANHLNKYKHIAFCFLDSTKDTYIPFYNSIIPNLMPEGILAIDNMISHKRSLREFIALVRQDSRITVEEIKIGTGIFICRKTKLL